jgi:nucleoside-diphosphate-sugar epimerase
VKVLVTGASGMLGGAVASQLAARGDEVTCFQRSASGTGLRDVLGDVRDAPALLRAAGGNDGVIHLAALVAPRSRWADAYAVNVHGAANAQQAARACGRLVHVSTPSVAFRDAPTVAGAAEPAAYAGRDTYARSKAMAERLVLERADVPTVVVRPHLVWGPGDTQLVGRIVARARQGRLAVPDHGRALIDTTYVDDAASAIVAALDRAEPGSEACGRAFVVTGSDPRPVGELIAGILRAAGLPGAIRSIPAPFASVAGRISDRLWRGTEPPITHFAARQLSVAHWFDQRDVRRVLRWDPRVGVDEGLERLAAWFSAKERFTIPVGGITVTGRAKPVSDAKTDKPGPEQRPRSVGRTR